MIRKKTLDRGDVREKDKNLRVETNRGSFKVLQGNKKREIDEILGIKDLKGFVEKRSMTILYNKNISHTAIENGLKPMEYIVIEQEMEIDSEMREDFDIKADIKSATRTLYYIYKNSVGDIMYFKNPFYEGNILKSMQKEYEDMTERKIFTNNGKHLKEHDIYNKKLAINLEILGYSPKDIHTLSEDLEKEIAYVVSLISSLDGKMKIKNIQI